MDPQKRDDTAHNEAIREQFTKQAVPFATSPSVRDEEALQLVIRLATAGPEDDVLDVACGPGIVTCAFAKRVSRATGIDITPAMIDQARELASSLALSNVTFQVGDILPLPYANKSFTIVVCRYAFHHLLDPASVLREMRRVCKPGGRVVVVDAAPPPDPARADAFNRMEQLRDPSHVRAMPLRELAGLYEKAGLPAPRVEHYRFEVDVDGLLERSFPAPGSLPAIRAMFLASVDGDGLGMASRLEGSRILCSYPIAALCATVDPGAMGRKSPSP